MSVYMGGVCLHEMSFRGGLTVLSSTPASYSFYAYHTILTKELQFCFFGYTCTTVKSVKASAAVYLSIMGYFCGPGNPVQEIPQVTPAPKTTTHNAMSQANQEILALQHRPHKHCRLPQYWVSQCCSLPQATPAPQVTTQKSLDNEMSILEKGKSWTLGRLGSDSLKCFMGLVS